MMRSSGVLNPAGSIEYHSSAATRATDDLLSREFLLVAACCRWPPSKSRDDAIGAAADPIDWDNFLRVVKRQRVAGLVHNALLSAAIGIPAPVALQIASDAMRILRRNLILASETIWLCNVLDAAQIPVVVFKGVALAQLAYGSLRVKHARDIDLLVPPDRAEIALRLLEQEGYALASPAPHLSDTQRRALIRYGREVELSHPDTRVRVELQWRVADNPMLLKDVDACSGTQNVSLPDGAKVRTLENDDLFAALCVHGALHAWSRLKWLADINALIMAHSLDITQLYRYAQAKGAGLCAGQALLLCYRLFDLQLPPALRDEFQTNRRVEKLTVIALSAMTDPHAGPEIDRGFLGVARVVRTQFLLGKGWEFFLAQCRVASVGPVDVIRLPLPRSLHFLYPLLRLPMWLWRRTLSAIGGKP